MHDELVDRRHWIDSEHFFHALSHCMLLPGPEAQQLAIYIGWKLNGTIGGVLAGALFVLPSMAILLILSLFYGKYGATAGVVWCFILLKPVVVALVLRALLRLGKRALQTPAQWAVAGVAVVAIIFFHLSLPWVLGVSLLVGIVKASYHRSKRGGRSESVKRPEVQSQSSKWFQPLQVVASCSFLAAVPIVSLLLLGHDMSFWSRLCGFFTRTAFVTLGGSYTVVPYVAQVAVVKYGWLTKSQMLDGFALAETTPGPLIIVVAFVGFMAGFHHFHGSFALGTVALLLTCFYTFLPCFLFVFLGAPWVSRSNGNSFVKEILQMITAVVVAAIVQLTIFLVRGVLLSEGSVGWRNIKWWAVVEIIGALLLLYLSSVRRPRR
jgi:chromate transporter